MIFALPVAATNLWRIFLLKIFEPKKIDNCGWPVNNLFQLNAYRGRIRLYCF